MRLIVGVTEADTEEIGTVARCFAGAGAPPP